jgi:hypothetical protein
LNDPVATGLLREYLVKCACEENLDFLVAVREYRQIDDQEALQVKFREIQMLYFGNAATRINVSGAKIHQIAGMHERDADHGTFERIADEIFNLLSSQYFARASETDAFEQYLRPIEVARDINTTLTQV